MNPRRKTGLSGARYRIKDKKIAEVIAHASSFHSQFLIRKQASQLKEAIKLMQANLKYVRVSRINKLDLAHYLRKYAFILMSGTKHPDRYDTAKGMLFEAREIFSSYRGNDPAVKHEYQLTLHQLRSIAYAVKDGELLESVISDFLPLAKKNNLPNYLIDCHESMYQLSFAKNDYERAILSANECIQLCNKAIEKYKDEKYQLKLLTQYSHLIKAHLAILQTDQIPADERNLYFINKVVIPFDSLFDERKKMFFADPEQRRGKTLLIKEFNLKFSIECHKFLSGLSRDGNPLKTVLDEAAVCFYSSGDKSCYASIRKMITERAKIARKTGSLPIDRRMFSAYEPPRLRFTPEQIERFLPESLEQSARRQAGLFHSPASPQTERTGWAAIVKPRGKKNQ